jgi:hypothetical protein
MKKYSIVAFAFVLTLLQTKGESIDKINDGRGRDECTGVEIPMSADLLLTSQTGVIRHVEIRAPWVIWCEAVENIKFRGYRGGPYYYWHLFRGHMETNHFTIEKLNSWYASNRIPSCHLWRTGLVREDQRSGGTNVNLYLPKNQTEGTDNDTQTSLNQDILHIIQSNNLHSIINILDSFGPSHIVYLRKRYPNPCRVCFVTVESNSFLQVEYDLDWQPPKQRFGANMFPLFAADAKTKTF